MENPKALLIIDMQRDLCYHEKRKEKVIKMLPSLKQAIDLFLAKDYPIYYICFSLSNEDEQFKRFGDIYCIEGTEGAEIISELQPVKGEIIFKKKHSAFFETDLEERLTKRNVKEIYLSGMQTHICIMTTAADASFRGFYPVAIRECVLSTNEKKKADALKWINDYVGQTKNMNSIILDFNLHQNG